MCLFYAIALSSCRSENSQAVIQHCANKRQYSQQKCRQPSKERIKHLHTRNSTNHVYCIPRLCYTRARAYTSCEHSRTCPRFVQAAISMRILANQILFRYIPEGYLSARKAAHVRYMRSISPALVAAAAASLIRAASEMGRLLGFGQGPKEWTAASLREGPFLPRDGGAWGFCGEFYGCLPSRARGHREL